MVDWASWIPHYERAGQGDLHSYPGSNGLLGSQSWVRHSIPSTSTRITRSSSPRITWTSQWIQNFWVGTAQLCCGKPTASWKKLSVTRSKIINVGYRMDWLRDFSNHWPHPPRNGNLCQPPCPEAGPPQTHSILHLQQRLCKL